MKIIPLLTLSLASAVAFSACDRKPDAEVTEVRTTPSKPVAETKTFETAGLRSAIDRYEKEPSAAHSADVKKAFAELDQEIAELNERVARTTGTERDEAAAKAKNLSDYKTAETVRFTKAQTAAGVGVTPGLDDRSAAQKVEDAAKDAGNKIEDAAKKAGDKIEETADKVGDKIEDATD